VTDPLVLTIDLGTQSVRAMLVDKTGNILYKTQHKYEKPYYSLHPGWAEQKPEAYWSAICDVTKRLRDAAHDRWSDIVAVTHTTIRGTYTCLDKEGKPLRDMILWLDKRRVEMTKPVPALNSFAFKLAGKTDTLELIRSTAPCNWIMQNEPEIWEKTYKFLFISGYINHKLTGRFVDSVANMIGYVPFNSKTRTWMGPRELNRCAFDIPNDKLNELIEPGEEIGPITAEAARETGLPEGIPLIATGSDKGCETLGLSCSTPEKAAIGLGTTATVQFTTDRYMEPLKFIPPYPAVLKGKYNPELQVFRGYWLISWFKNEFASKEVEEAVRLNVTPEQLLNDKLKAIPAGCEGLVFQPYFTPGIVMPAARGAVIGFSDIHTRTHIYRAIIEGINFALMDGLYNMERRGGVKITKLFVAGGGSQSDEICQITADMFGKPLYRIQTYEASGLGSSIVAFISKGIYSDAEEAAASMIRVKDEFLPNPDQREIYKNIFDEVFIKIFGKLLPLYKRNERYSYV
jgi:sugar (pentulose or hexulose) kinase